jgi:hypothetical protein
MSPSEIESLGYFIPILGYFISIMWLILGIVISGPIWYDRKLESIFGDAFLTYLLLWPIVLIVFVIELIMNKKY